MENVNVSGNNNAEVYQKHIIRASGTQESAAARPDLTVSQSKLVASLKNLMAGEAFSGRITAADGGKVTISLPDGASVLASLQDGAANISVGQNMTFLVQSNDGTTVVLKPMQMVSEQENYIAGKALEAAGLADNPSNQELVKELLNQNMSISSQTLNDMAKAVLRFPDADINTLTRLYKLNIPITQENIEQFEAYKSYENSITGDINDLSKGLSQSIAELLELPINAPAPEGGGQQTAAALFKNTLHILYGEDISSANEAESIPQQDVENAAGGSEFIGKFLDDASREKLLNSMQESFGKHLPGNLSESIQNGSISAKQLASQLAQLLEKEAQNPKEAAKLFASKEFSSLMGMVMRDTMQMSPESMKDKQSIQDFYKKLHNNAEELAREISEKAGKDSPVSKSLDHIKNNIEFMNDLNKNMAFYQMPFRFAQSSSDGELYVFTNKKRLKQDGGSASALLHLDMTNLGSVDIFVRLAGKSVSTNFCLESEELLDFIYSHIDQLSIRLEALGYNCRFEMKIQQKDEKKFDFIEDFIDADIAKAQATTQFIFDRRA